MQGYYSAPATTLPYGEDDEVVVEYGEAWDCDPDFMALIQPHDLGLDEEDDAGDWQVLALDRFGDRLVQLHPAY